MLTGAAIAQTAQGEGGGDVHRYAKQQGNSREEEKEEEEGWANNVGRSCIRSQTLRQQ